MRILKIALIAIWGLLTFVAFELLVFTPLFLLGLPLVWWASRYADLIPARSRVEPTRWVVSYVNPVLDWWIGNYEDGVSPGGWTIVKWFLRNPVTNLRFTPVFSTRPSRSTSWAGSVNEIPPDGTAGWFLAWSRGYVGFRYQRATTIVWGICGVWLGWKVNPRDAERCQLAITAAVGSALPVSCFVPRGSNVVNPRRKYPRASSSGKIRQPRPWRPSYIKPWYRDEGMWLAVIAVSMAFLLTIFIKFAYSHNLLH